MRITGSLYLRPMLRILKLTAALLFISCVAPAQAPDGNTAVVERLAAKDYGRAASLLDSLGEEYRSAEYYLTLGNAQFEAGAPGRAILAYERGLRIQPGHNDLANNLRFVREEAGVNVGDPPSFFILRWWQLLGALVGTTVAYSLGLLCWWVALGLALFWYLRRRSMEEKRRFVLLPVAGLMLGLAILCYTLGATRYTTLHRQDVAILTVPVANLRVAPLEGGTVEGALEEGSRLRITDTVGRYVKVELYDGRQGYLLSGELTVI